MTSETTEYDSENDVKRITHTLECQKCGEQTNIVIEFDKPLGDCTNDED